MCLGLDIECDGDRVKEVDGRGEKSPRVAPAPELLTYCVLSKTKNIHANSTQLSPPP